MIRPGRRLWTRFGLAIAMVGLLLGGTVGANEFRDANRQLSVNLPPDWVAMPPDELQRMNAEADRLAPGRVHYIAGYRRQGGQLPYLLIQWQSGSTFGATFDQFERDASRGLKKAIGDIQAKADFLNKVTPGEVVADRSRNRLIFRLEMVDQAGIRIQSLSFMHLGRHGVASIHFYSTPEELAGLTPQFQSIADSFRFDPGAEFVPGAPLGGMILGTALGGLGGAIVGVMLATAFGLFRRS